MLVPLSWLKEYVNITVTPQELAERLVSAGFEVEEIRDMSEAIKNVVVGQVLEIAQHPHADKLVVCKIDVKSEILQIVTGADNIKVGDFVPVALSGAILPDGKAIKKGKLRGIVSEGMLCGGEELGLTEGDYPGAEVYGILILQEDAVLGEDINITLGTNEIVFDISVTANRPDCNSVYGIAREVAAILQEPIKPLSIGYQTSSDCHCDIKLTVTDSVTCPHYMARKVDSIVLKDSPQYIKRRLKAVGIRPINNIVDITNYVLIEVGQPMHAFDEALISDKEIIVRRAANKEKLILLDESERILDESMLVIADKNRPIALAGVMGGKQSGINEKTKCVIFESAKFARESIRRTSRKLNAASDSSKRFEKGVDFYSQKLAMERALTLIFETESGKISAEGIEFKTTENEEHSVKFSSEQIGNILGISIDENTIVSILNRLGIECKKEGETVSAKIPPYRSDLWNANDIAEEVIRLYGYEHIQSTLLDAANQTKGGRTKKQKLQYDLENLLADKGYSQIITYSFTSPSLYSALDMSQEPYISIMNPLGNEQSIMRTTLIYNTLQILASNITKGNKQARTFEFARIYQPSDDVLPKEKERICIAEYGEKFDFYHFKNIVECMFEKCNIIYTLKRSNLACLHPGKSADLYINESLAGSFGELNPKIAENFDIKIPVMVGEFDFDLIAKKYKNTIVFEPLKKHQAVERDFAVIVSDDTMMGDVIGCIQQACGNILEKAELFDVFKGGKIKQGYKSMAFRLTLRSNKTLTEKEINKTFEKAIQSVVEKFHAELRDS